MLTPTRQLDADATSSNTDPNESPIAATSSDATPTTPDADAPLSTGWEGVARACHTAPGLGAPDVDAAAAAARGGRDE